ncbi:TlpA disulfide reductase family protein [Sediminibacter sp. Hel_I_10]|uniref:TlpA family protein disulfide reductase n=1 Tax=Sediminibacter sp. Hel_I_10 TaxID=1392490 RepID=UPI00047DFC75|nr:TlpA disulfide reductase family protein [Sediminibacter sp. Hel_I_10]
MKRVLLFLFFLPALMIAQNSISGVFSPVEDYTYALLYKATPTGTEFMEQAKLAGDGSFSIALDSSITAGIYKIVYATPPERFNFDLIYNGKESIAFTFNETQGLEISESKENKLWQSYLHSIDMVNRTISNFYTQESTDKAALKSIFKTAKDTQTAFEEAAKDMMVAPFIKSNAPYIPPAYEDLATYTKNLKRAYLEQVDFGNALLQSSDFLSDKVMAFIFGMTSENNADYKKHVDILVNSIGEGQKVIKIILLEQVWRNFKTLDNQELANYVSDNYLLQLSQQFNYDALTEDLIASKNNAIGAKAQDFKIDALIEGKPTKTTLHELNMANQYLLIFWSSTCGHCLEELPKVKALLADNKDITVIAIGLEDDAKNWKKAITNYPDFIHVLGLEKWDNPISDAYGVEATPSYFLLDSDKTILAKPHDHAALEKLIKR